jgi:cell division protease FtsH
MALPGQDPVHKISIIPRGIGALGYTIQRTVPTQVEGVCESVRTNSKAEIGRRQVANLILPIKQGTNGQRNGHVAEQQF